MVLIRRERAGTGIASALGGNVKKTFELGSSNPLIILDDADLGKGFPVAILGRQDVFTEINHCSRTYRRTIS
jgi:hypothetical protein